MGCVIGGRGMWVVLSGSRCTSEVVCKRRGEPSQGKTADSTCVRACVRGHSAKEGKALVTSACKQGNHGSAPLERVLGSCAAAQLYPLHRIAYAPYGPDRASTNTTLSAFEVHHASIDIS